MEKEVENIDCDKENKKTNMQTTKAGINITKEFKFAPDFLTSQSISDIVLIKQ